MDDVYDVGSWSLFQPQAPAQQVPAAPKEEAKPEENKLSFLFDPGAWIFWAVVFIVVLWVIFI